MGTRQKRGGRGSRSDAAAVDAESSSTANEHSRFLNTLETLQDSVWPDLLLPMLVAQGSAGDCAMSCKLLRQLCQSKAAVVKVSVSECMKPAAVLTLITQHFPACSSLGLAINSEQQGAELRPVLPQLSRLTCLSSLAFELSTSSSKPQAITPILRGIQQQLTQLRSLSLSLTSAWGSNSMPWQALSLAGQLQSLQISFEKHLASPFALNRCLAGLAGADGRRPISSSSLSSSLTCLKISAGLSNRATTDYQRLSHLTALQQLSLPVVSTQGLDSMASCTALRSLELTMRIPGNQSLIWLDGGALAQLTLLTELRLKELASLASSPAFLAVLQQLRQLAVLQAQEFSAKATLPVLAHLTKLTELDGSWLGAETGTAGRAASATAAGSSVVCSSVRQLGGAGPIPFEAFPNLEAVTQHAPWPPALFSSLCQHCPNIRRLDAGEGFSYPPTEEAMYGDARVLSQLAQHLDTIRDLVKLQSLEELTLNLEHCVELSVLATEGLQQLKVLRVVLGYFRSTIAAGLMSLAKLPRLELLVIELPKYAHMLEMMPCEVQCLLGALSDGPAVRMLLPPTPEMTVKEALSEAKLLGLKLPADFRIEDATRLCYGLV